MLGKDHIGNCGSCWVRIILGTVDHAGLGSYWEMWIMLGKDHTGNCGSCWVRIILGTVDHAG